MAKKKRKLEQPAEEVAAAADVTVVQEKLGMLAPPQEAMTLDSILPGAIRTPKKNLSDAIVLIYGPPKIGKTTLASKWPGAWFLATEQGQRFVKTRPPTMIESWEQFLEIAALIDEKRPTQFKDGKLIRTIVIDTIDLLFKMCYDNVCAGLGISSPADLEWGQGWTALTNEFQRVISKICRWPYGLVCISHAREREIKTKGTKVHRIEPDMMSTGGRIIHGAADIILYCFMDEIVEQDGEGKTISIRQERRIRCAPGSSIIAGDRTGCLPDEIEMSFDALAKCFTDTAKQES